jgi:hypothetical protein
MPRKTDRRGGIRHEPAAAIASQPVRLVDLSTHGCCLGFAAVSDYRPGQFIRLGLPGEAEPMRAIVRWIEDRRVGAEFTRGLAPDRIEAILAEERQPMIGLL